MGGLLDQGTAQTVGLAQSAVSQHLKILAEVRFVLVQPGGTARHYRINDACVGCFPSATCRHGLPGPQPERSLLMADLTVRPMTGGDADRVLAIYQTGLDGGDASFETTAPAWAAFDAGKLPDHRFVAVDDDDYVIGWVAVSPTSTRAVYAGVVEHSVYIDPAARGRGAGRLLLNTLIVSTEAAGIWTIQSGVFPENTPSLALHQRAGFRVIGIRERVARHHGRWRDVILLERRSPTIA